MRARAWWAVALFLALPGPQAAARQPEEGQSLSREIIQAERRSIVKATMRLDESQGAIFWPLYDAYREEVGLVNQRWVKLIEDYVEAGPSLDGARADELLDEWVAMEKSYLEARTKWVRRFRKKLPSPVVVRFFQLENKLDAVVRAEIARVVPLAR